MGLCLASLLGEPTLFGQLTTDFSFSGKLGAPGWQLTQRVLELSGFRGAHRERLVLALEQSDLKLEVGGVPGRGVESLQ
jgi:hypothetical protein